MKDKHVLWLSQGWLSLSFLAIATFFTSGQSMNIHWLPLYCTCLSCWLYIAIWDLLLIWNQSVQGFLWFISVCIHLYVVIKRGGWDTINKYDPITFLCLPHIGIVIAFSVFVLEICKGSFIVIVFWNITTRGIYETTRMIVRKFSRNHYSSLLSLYERCRKFLNILCPRCCPFWTFWCLDR